MLDFSGGTSLLADVLFCATVQLRHSFHRGRMRVRRRNARYELNLGAPAGRLHIDGETYYG
jgi:hypothetical protein